MKNIAHKSILLYNRIRLIESLKEKLYLKGERSVFVVIDNEVLNLSNEKNAAQGKEPPYTKREKFGYGYAIVQLRP